MPGDTSNSKAPLSDTVYFSPNLQYKNLPLSTIVWSMVEEIRYIEFTTHLGLQQVDFV